MKSLVIGLLAHVDAGKTTLTEALLCRGGVLQKPGRVDHRNAFLDTDALERERGITIFSKQALLPLENRTLILLDTPGHVDFSAETERTLGVLDYAVLVISGTDGVQSHTETLWQLLNHHGIPVFVFVNKMDLPGTDRDRLLSDLRSRLDENCVPLRAAEDVATCSEALMEEYLARGCLSPAAVAAAIRKREVFPVCFGSALRLEGVDEFLQLLEDYTLFPDYPENFSARVYKISRDTRGERLTWMKLTGGALRAKTVLRGHTSGTREVWEEKADQLRIYSGEKFRPVPHAEAGQICAVTGLTQTYSGEGLGGEPDAPLPELESVVTCQLLLPEGCDAQSAFARLRELEEEDPLLQIRWDSRLRAIFVRLMGRVQQEVLKRRIADRFGLAVEFGPEQILYRETVAAPAEGVGHFEPLRHYAEIHLLLEPGEPGSGVVLDTACPEDELDGHWQRLILGHLAEREQLGVLTGAPVTDIKITLLSGRASLKHTEGGDFREATFRAVRMGLMRTRSVLLEPWYRFRLDLPEENVGRAMADIRRFGGSCEVPERRTDRVVLNGEAPVAALRSYGEDVAVYSRGQGRLTLRSGGYRPCPNQEEIVQAADYDPTADLENSPDSVFCAHGSGFSVKWSDVPQYMHLPWAYVPPAEPGPERQEPIRRGGATYSGTLAEDRELQKIYERTYGAVKERSFFPSSVLTRPDARQVAEYYGPEETFLLVDGYNVIFAWDDLNALARDDLDAARNRLIETLCNYQGFVGCGVILVFDAYRIPGGAEHMEKVNNIFVVYTKQAEKADTYIERTTFDLGKQYRIRVVTSDGMEQRMILGHDAGRISSRAFRAEVEDVQRRIEQRIRENNARPL